MKIAFFVLAGVFLLLALAGVAGNLKFLAEGQGLPADPAQRLGFLIGMWACPASLFVIGSSFGLAALLVKRRPRA